jgi:3-oxoacyl-[acyl-carrier protein] reductase
MESEWGTPHALIHCAGATTSGLFARSQPETWEALLDANLRSALHAARAVIPGMMRQGGGSILFVGSLAALRPRPGQAVYAAAKGALESLTRALARELAPKAIRVNTLAPGFLDTPMVRALPPATQAALLDTIPLGRLGTVDEIARACLFWASPQSAYTTGQVIRIDGGASC